MEMEIKAHPFDGVALVYTTVATLFTASSITWALYTVSKHPRLSTTVKSYFYCEHGLRLSLISMYFSWGTMCILWSADEALPWFGAIIGYLCQSAAIAACMAQLIFSINRFFAISFGGRYYAKLFSGRWWPQVFLFVVVSMGPASVNLVPGNNAYYNKMIYAMLAQDGELSFYYSIIMQAVFPLSVWTVTMILDIIMLRKLTIQRKTFAARTTAMKTEWRLAMQMIVNHLSNSMNIVEALILYAFPTDNLFHLFLISTLMTVVLPGLYGLNVVIFLRVPRKSRNQSVIPVSTQGPISKTKLPRST